MNVADVITELNGHGFEDTTDTQKVLVINDTIWEVESREPWPFLEKSIALNFNGVSASPTNMPTDFNKISFMVDTSNGVGIWPERMETIRDRYGDQFLTATSANPFAYYIWGGTPKFYPIPPASTGRFYMDYIATQSTLVSTDLEAAILLPKRHHRIITLGSVWKLYAQEDDLENAQFFQSAYEDRLVKMKEDLFRKQYQRPDIVFMTDADDDPEYYLP